MGAISEGLLSAFLLCSHRILSRIFQVHLALPMVNSLESVLQGDLDSPVEGGLWTLRPGSSLCFLLLSYETGRTRAAHHAIPDTCKDLLVLLPS